MYLDALDIAALKFVRREQPEAESTTAMLAGLDPNFLVSTACVSF